MAVTKQEGKTKVAPRAKVAHKKVGAGTKRAAPKVPHTNSHNAPSAPKRGNSGKKASMLKPMQGVSVVEYPGESARGGRGSGFKGVKTVGYK